MSIKYLDMFSGIGGFRSGLEAVGGFECIGYCEIDQYARRAYEAMYNTEGEMYFEDATKINPDDLPDIDLICGGFPCQAFSIAGRRNGFNDTRGTLFFEIARIAAVKRPALLFLENVPGLLNHDKGRTFQTILSALDEIGYDVSWTVLNSANFGVPQARKRVYITGFLRGKCAGEVFTFPDTNPKTIVRRVPGSEGRRVYTSDGVGITLTTSGGGGSTGLYLIPLPVKSNTKDGYQFAFPNDSIDISYLTMNTRRGRVGAETAHTLTTNSTQAFYFIDMNPNAKITELARCITARHNSGICHRHGEHSAVMVILKKFTADELLTLGDTFNNYWTIENPNKDTVTAMIIVDGNGNFFVGYIRRLTPRECFRLQGFTDTQFDKVKAIGMSDARLYKMAGNAVSVPVISALGEQLKRIYYGGVS
ncbi:MAG: DNA (cytosine-5-)-methyltransferase [Acetobacter sp.]|nr:DNA (cytosine-5-)-methyltransferase [Bacteroides sp.]MCM1340806.1 DNA (cytosine-5-)-methyltransferase [Acetobacter sp.]MCM1432637.1 DNA (cytosine-5-)-methyltransferase [Clostridiales bacterium]